MNDELLKSAREVIGDYLRQRREEKGLSRYRVMQMAGWSRIDPILKIERGESYGIDTLLRYLQATDTYLFFGDKEKKDPASPLDTDDMMRAIDASDPKL